jgi:pimeloyl-ACP methyl ester carboxylesterase
MDLAIGDFAYSVNESWLGLVEQCRQNVACQARFPDLKHRLEQAKAQLDNAPTAKQMHPKTGEAISVQVDQIALLSVLRSMFYHPTTRALIPYTIEATSQADNRPLLAQMSMAQQQKLADGLFLEISCNEDFPLFLDSYDPLKQATLSFDNGRLTSKYKLMCEQWPNNQSRYALDRTPIISDIPTLLISGEYDPVTPPSYGERVAKGLSNGRHIVVKNAAHTALFHSCLAQSIDQFIDSADVNQVEVDCIADTPAHWFMTDANAIE